MHCLGLKYFNKNQVESILEKAVYFKSTKNYTKSLQDAIVVNMFFENSTRTKTSFEIAALKLGARVVNFDYTKSSLQKGENWIDTITNLNAMHPDFFVTRHAYSGFAYYISQFTQANVINAGDGTNEHPSQALLDLMTMYEHKKDIENLKVCIIGDIINSRVARSHMYLAKMFNWDLSFYGPSTFLPQNIDIKIEKDLNQAISNKDFVILLRIQLERKSGVNIPSLGEYNKFFGIKEPIGAYIMHPGPVNRDVELDSTVYIDRNVLITKQVENGVFVRMAIFDFCISN
ncbi:MAG: aspartate carbamoyltransferase catalytic subunit [Desulfurella sp.]|uniref:aspartate carbamoyltransferase catalytic subunit n=1 Tax=Desulfurella sp. TaxID=1962857 RepID=UPI003D104333